MIAFSFSRVAFIGLLAALILAILLAFFGGWLIGVSHAPVGTRLATETQKEPVSAPPSQAPEQQSAQPAAQSASAPPAPSASPAKASEPAAAPAPAGRPAPAAAPALAQPAAAPGAAAGRPPAPAGGVAAGAVPPAGTEQALPPSPLTLAMVRPLERFGLAAPTAADIPPPEKQEGTPVLLLPEPRSAPQEMNARLGRLENAAQPVYSVEVGTFTTEMAAERLYARLEGRRYDVYRVKAEPPLVPQTVIAIRIGAYDQRPLADAAALELRSQEGLDARVVRVDPARLADLLKAIKK